MIKLLVIVGLILLIVAIFQLIRVFELSAQLKGNKHVQVNDNDNRLNGRLMMLFLISFMAFCAWQVWEYKDRMLPVAASKEGAEIDWLMDFNMIIIWAVFVLCNILLFYFAYKYYGRKGQVATYFPHDNKLEMIWTVIPAIVLAVIIIYGLKTWNAITTPASSDSMVIELYAKQFDWTARYAGKDNTLGSANYRLIEGTNALGMDSTDEKGADDMIVKGEMHIPKGKEVSFHFRSRDVIHSAFMPHFRQQMNCVPGMTTYFKFTPTISTAEMRKITKNDKFDYLLLCNKICGASHYNMQMAIVVDEPEDYAKWLEKQKPFFNKSTASAVATETKEIVQK